MSRANRYEGAETIFYTRSAVFAGTDLCLHSCGNGERCRARLWKSTVLVETEKLPTSALR